ncbi:MAG: ATP-grasp domain-containing protein [candidate division Zixibacteria bacterium]|nr:ATP-grasp domain-containing protein [candidate division Zixibacteria bacterium]
MNLEVVVGSDFCQVLAKEWDIPLSLRLRYVAQAVDEIVDYAREHPLDAIVPVDDYTTEIAARACKVLGLPHNTPEAAIAARNKYRMRELLSAAGVWCPCFARFDLSLPVEEIALEQRYPCVLKPVLLSGSRGVIRADSPDGFIEAFRRIGRMLESASDRPPSLDPDAHRIMVESYMPGQEVALEGLLNGGRLRVLTLFDKPDPLEGPFFEETIYVTPSRLPEETQEVVSDAVQRASTAVGLTEGPVHAELRVHHGEARIIEIAGRSIGGLCSRVLEYGLGVSLEELILRHALGQDVDGVGRKAQGCEAQDCGAHGRRAQGRGGTDRGTDSEPKGMDDAGNKPGAAGVMMLPVPVGGLFQGFDGVEEAKNIPGVEDVVVTAKEGDMLTPLPEGAGYPGFIFAKGDEPGQVEQVLRKAHGRLRMRVKTVLAT